MEQERIWTPTMEHAETASAHDRAGWLDETVRYAADLVDADCGAILSYDPSGQHLAVLADHGQPPLLPDGDAAGATRALLKEMAAALSSGGMSCARQEQPPASFLAVPLGWQQQRLNILSVARKTGAAFGEREVDRLDKFARQAARSLREADAPAIATDLLHRINRAAAAARRLHAPPAPGAASAGLAAVAEQAADLFAAAVCDLLLVSGDKVLRVAASTQPGLRLRPLGDAGLPPAVRTLGTAGFPRLALTGDIPVDLALLRGDAERLLEAIRVSFGDSEVEYIPLLRPEDGGGASALIGALRLSHSLPHAAEPAAQVTIAIEEAARAIFTAAAVAAIDRAQLSEESLHARQHYEMLAAAIPCAVIAADSAGLVTELNPSAALLLGCDPVDLVGKPLEDLYVQSDEILHPDRALHAGGAGVAVGGAASEAEVNGRNGERIPVRHIRVVTEAGAGSGRSSGALVVLEDRRAPLAAQRREAILHRASLVPVPARREGSGMG